MPDAILFSGLANMIVENAYMKQWVSAMLAYSTFGLENRILASYAKRDGGVSVGGTICLTTDALTFEANCLNRAAISGHLSFSLPRREIIRAMGANGFISGTLSVITVSGEFKFRCSGAPHKAQMINDQTSRM